MSLGHMDSDGMYLHFNWHQNLVNDVEKKGLTIEILSIHSLV